MRVLFIAPRLPLPADTGGKIRTFNLLKQISRDHTVDLVTFSFDGEDAWHVQGFRELGIAVTLVQAPKDDTLRKAITVLFSALPYSVSKYHSEKMKKAIVALKARKITMWYTLIISTWRTIKIVFRGRRAWLMNIMWNTRSWSAAVTWKNRF